jgi:ATP-dependent RNA helicase UAP56/SUB2
MFQNHPDGSSSDEDEKVKPTPNPRAPTNQSPWKDLFLRDELLRALRDAVFDYPSEIQRRAIPVVLQGSDVLVQAKSGVGKTAVFVIAVLSQLVVDRDGEFKQQQCLVLCHCRELAHQIYKEFHRFGKYFRNPPLRLSCYFGGLSIQDNLKDLANV